MIEMKIEEIVREEIRNLKAYQVKEFPVEIKLDANESSYCLPEEFLDELFSAIKKVSFNRYPDPNAVKLKEVICQDLGVDRDKLIIGNGSDELIQSIIIAFGGERERVLFPVPTFAMYEILSIALGQVPIKVPLDDKWDLDLDAMKRAIKEENPRIIFLSFPNNPTGNCFSSDKVLEIISLSKGIVVLDEAYFDFGRKSFLDSLKDFKNLIVLRSLSKIGMAGLRIGMMIADSRLVEQVAKVKLPYNVNIISQEIARFILTNKGIIDRQIGLIIKEREKLAGEMKGFDTITPFPTNANFILFKEKSDNRIIWDALLKNGILIKDLNHMEFLKNCLRVTIGTEQENRRFLEALKQI